MKNNKEAEKQIRENNNLIDAMLKKEKTKNIKFQTMWSPEAREMKEKFKTGNPKIKKYGKEIDVRNWIQENSVDTALYDTLEKYGTIKMHGRSAIEALEEIKSMDLRDVINYGKQAEELWKSLNIEVRNEFNNDKNEFMRRGNDWANQKIKEAQEAQKRATEQAEIETEKKYIARKIKTAKALKGEGV